MRSSHRMASAVLLACLGFLAGWSAQADDSRDGAPTNTGPCANWTCTGGPYAGTFEPIPGGGTQTNTCVINIGTVPSCQNQNTTGCDPYKSKGNGPPNATYYGCAGKDASNSTCYVWFYGCQ
jgi:hypothetical protein